MFSKEMIAPCGLNCGICSQFLREENPCCGCRSDGPVKSEYCASLCYAVTCKILPQLKDGFCDACPDYPCPEVQEKQDRYTSAYPVIESPMENLAAIREMGMAAFLEMENRRWHCDVCGSVICVHDGKCSGCGKQFTSDDM